MLAALLLAVTSQAPIPHGMPRTSFAEARARVFADPSPEPFPPTGVLPESTVLSDGKNILKRFSRIVKEPADFRTAPSTKLLHKYGVCADAVWEIDAPSQATGLFREGTRVPALVRFATGTNRTVHLPLVPRTWGVSVKLFPSRDPHEPVVTANLLLFDQHGLDGQARPHFLRALPGDPPLVFSNQASAHAPHALALLKVLELYDRHPLYRSLAPLAGVDVVDATPFAPRVPELVQLWPRPSPAHAGALPDDYREELRAYAPGELVFDIVLPSQPLSPRLARIGTLVIGDTVVSPACDTTLQFWHPPVPYGQHVPE